jgi:hypothetical protein
MEFYKPLRTLRLKKIEIAPGAGDGDCFIVSLLAMTLKCAVKLGYILYDLRYGTATNDN